MLAGSSHICGIAAGSHRDGGFVVPAVLSLPQLQVSESS